MQGFLEGGKGLKRVFSGASSDYTTGAIVLVFGPGGEEGQFADMSEPAGRRRQLLSSAGAQVCKQEEQRCGGGEVLKPGTQAQRDSSTRHELISLVAFGLSAVI